MNRPVIVLLSAAALGAGGFYLSARSRVGSKPRVDAASEPEKHWVTPGMLAATEVMARREAPPFRLPGTDGRTYTLGDLAGEGPVVLAFIKDGCPCSSDAQPFFNRLQAAYGREVRFLGVIDVDTDRGRAWGQKNATTFPLLADPALAAIHAYSAESSAYVAVIDRDGKIDRLYPGYSKSMLAELGDRLAALAGVPPRPIDAAGAPPELVTGCPYGE